MAMKTISETPPAKAKDPRRGDSARSARSSNLGILGEAKASIYSQRAPLVTEQLRRGIRVNRANVAVLGAPTIDSTVANQLVQTVEASRLIRAGVIITGRSSEIAQTLVSLGGAKLDAEPRN